MSLESTIRGVLTNKQAPQEITEAVKPEDKGEYDQEGDMAKTQLRGVMKDAEHMIKMFGDDDNLPEWVQAKIIKAADYLKSAHNYMMNKDEEVKEEWVCGKCNCDPCTCEESLQEAVSPKSIEMSMRKALKDRGNYKNGKVNWNFIDADVYMELNPEKAEVRSFYRMFDQIATKLTKELNIKEETDLGEAKDFIFRFATSDAGKEYQKMKAQQRRDMNKKNDPGADKKGLAISVHDMDKAKKKAKARLGRIPSRARYGGSSKYDHNTGKLQYGKPNLPENVELDEGINQKKFAAGAKAMKAYAMKHGGVDKADFMKVADSLATISRINLLQAGQELTRLNRLVDNQDTDVRERIYVELKKVGLVEALEEKFANPAQQAAVMAKLKKDGKYKEEVDEKTLTPAELKKREEIAKAIERENPDMPMPQKMAIATAQAKKTAEAYDEPQGQAKRMMSPLHKARMDKEKADRDRDGKLKPGITKEEVELEEAKKVSSMQIHKVLAKTKNSREGIAALKKAFRVSDMEAKKMLDRVMNEELDEAKKPDETVNIRQSLKKAIDMRGQKEIVFKDGSKAKISVQDAEKAMKMLDNTRMAKAKQDLTIRMMKSHQDFKDALAGKKPKVDPFALRVRKEDNNPKIVRHLELAKKARAEGDYDKANYHTQLARQMQSEGTFISKFKEELKEKKRGMSETKGAPKGYHFTRSGQLKKGDAGQDGPGGKMLRSDPLDKQRKKIPPLPENDK